MLGKKLKRNFSQGAHLLFLIHLLFFLIMKTHFLLFCMLICVLVSSVAIGQQARYGNNIYVEGEVSGVWMADTVFVTGDITLPRSEYLEIMPGVFVEFQGYYGFYVRGDGLDAVGTPQAPIVFSVNDTTGLHDIYSPDGGWKGIIILGEQEKGIPGPYVDFQYCHIEYAKAIYGEQYPYGGGLYIQGNGNFSFYKTTFFRNLSYFHGGGAYFLQSNPNFHSCVFMENEAGHPPTELETFGSGGGLFGKHGGGNIIGNTFLYNVATGVGGGLCLDSSDVLIQSNTLKHNYAIIGGGLGYLRSQNNKGIVNNLIAENASTFFGGGIGFITFEGTMLNNSIVNNQSSMGGGMYLNEAASPKIWNSIFWGNQAGVPGQSQVFIWDVWSVPDFYYCNMQYGTDGIGGASFEGEYLDCIEDDPMFTGAGDHPYQLQDLSPAIDAGDPQTDPAMLPTTDLAGNPRIVGGLIDIGAYEHQGATGELFDVTFNPVNAAGENVEYAVVTFNGITYNEGDYVFQNIPPGTYSYNIYKTCHALAEGEVLVTDHDTEVVVVMDWIPGDANGDQQVNVVDLIIIVNYFVGIEPQFFCFENADANGDGFINVLDAIVTAQIFAGGNGR